MFLGLIINPQATDRASCTKKLMARARDDSFLYQFLKYVYQLYSAPRTYFLLHTGGILLLDRYTAAAAGLHRRALPAGHPGGHTAKALEREGEERRLGRKKYDD